MANIAVPLPVEEPDPPEIIEAELVPFPCPIEDAPVVQAVAEQIVPGCTCGRITVERHMGRFRQWTCTEILGIEERVAFTKKHETWGPVRRWFSRKPAGWKRGIR